MFLQIGVFKTVRAAKTDRFAVVAWSSVEGDIIIAPKYNSQGVLRVLFVYVTFCEDCYFKILYKKVEICA